jgi:hypothetical protein
LPVEVEQEPVQRTATPLPGTAPEPFNPHARGKGRLPVKVIAGPTAGQWERDVEAMDLDDSPF